MPASNQPAIVAAMCLKPGRHITFFAGMLARILSGGTVQAGDGISLHG